jgi:hypothetical protein
LGRTEARPTDYKRAVVVDAESKKTNKTTLRSEWRGVQKKVCKKEKQALTQPALLEIYDCALIKSRGTQMRVFRNPAVEQPANEVIPRANQHGHQEHEA